MNYMKKNFKPTQPVPLPYKGAPLTTRDIIMQQVRFEDAFYPHLVYTHSEEVMRKELSQPKTPITRNMFLGAITKSYKLFRV